MRRALLAAFALLAISGCGDEGEEVERAMAPAGSPNLLVVMTDDQTASTFIPGYMPRTAEFFADGGTDFTQAIASPPLCCPARAGFLTGRYAQNHGVVENSVGYGSLRDEKATLPVALQSAGYRTGLAGKFMNGYDALRGPSPGPGFDDWYAAFGAANYFDFQVSDGGEVTVVDDYSTTAYTDRAIEFTKDAHADEMPFFLWLSYNAPHTVAAGNDAPCEGEDAQPPSADAFAEFAEEPLPRPGSFDEADVSDKPSLADGPGRLRAGRLAETERSWRCGLAALRAVDSDLRRLLDSLRATGELEQTVVVFLSDNGYFYGEHRLTTEKRIPLEPALRVPLAIRVGSEVRGGSGPRASGELISQVDLAPTLFDYAGVDPCEYWKRCVPMDGRSLRPLLEAKGDWPTNRMIPLTLDEGWAYSGLRGAGELYVEFDASRWRDFGTGPAVEYYDLASDPDQLSNLAADSRGRFPRLDDLGARLRDLERCAGIEGRDERTPGKPFCE